MKTKEICVTCVIVLVIFLTTSIGYADLNDGLMAYYPFNGNTSDTTGNFGLLTVYGAKPAPDRFGNTDSAYIFDGIDDGMAGNSYDLIVPSAQGSFTLAFWFKPTSLWVQGSNPNGTLVGNQQAGNLGLFDWGILTALTWSNPLYFWWDQGDPRYLIATPTSWSPDLWYHIVCSYDVTSKNLKMWINGILDNSVTMLDDIGRDAAGSRLQIAHYGGIYVDMTLDELRIYNRALSADEIRELINSPPVVTITSPISGFLASVNTPVQFTGLIDDPDVEDSHTAVWTISSESGSEDYEGTVSDGSVDDSFQFSQAGIYSISLTVADAAGESDTATTVNGLPAFIVVYDPSAGFVTGGGWIYSPAGSLLDSSAAGKATFGFVAKYKQGATTPQGNTEFHFQAGDFRFKSSSHEWLVIAGSKAMFKGEGYIDGMGGGFKFMLTAVDSTEDKFRIKIWNPLTEDVIYDNKRGESDEAEPTTIGGGSIVIHKK
jgi:hypothetical protein